ncbi:hypothetical protein H6F89_25565 [Cyanobacteria bacterium FACHB-63]|nr:hypothetical protein [Cyanobacteria bacterium FACHB-63]
MQTVQGRARRIKSCIGKLTLHQQQAQRLGVERYTRISPMLIIPSLPTVKTTPPKPAVGSEDETIPGAIPENPTAIKPIQPDAVTQMSSTITSMAGNADRHLCLTLLPIPPHGPGVVINGSKTVLVNGLPACPQSDRILEAIGPLNRITKGCTNVLVGG